MHRLLCGERDKTYLELAMKKAREDPVLQQEFPRLEQTFSLRALRYAALGNHLELTKELFQRATKISKNHRTPESAREIRNYFRETLKSAVENGNSGIVEFLLSKRVRSTGKDLRIAAEKNDLNMIEILIRYGANQWDYGQRGAKKGGNEELRKFFSRKLAGM